MAATPLPMALGTMTQYVAQSPTLMSALAGGGATDTFVNQASSFKSFYQWVQQQPSSAWTAGTDSAGNPTSSITQGSCSITVHTRLNSPAATTTTNTTSSSSNSGFEWNNQTYTTIGSLNATIAWQGQPAWVCQVPFGVAESYSGLQLSSIVWSQVLKPIVSNFVNAVRTCLSGASSGASSTASTAESAAGDAAVDGEVVEGGAADAAGGEAADVAVSVVAGPVAVVALILVFAASIVLEDFLLHTTYHTLTMVNLTPFDISWGISVQEGALNSAPQGANTSGAVTNVLPAMNNSAPEGFPPVISGTEAVFQVNSTSELEGLGYVVPFIISDPTILTPQSAQAAADTIAEEIMQQFLAGKLPPSAPSVPGFLSYGAVAFDVPYSGDNSLAASFTCGSAESFYSNMEGQNTSLSYNCTQASSQGTINLTVTYDAVSGNSYNYNSLAVFWMS